MKYAEVPNVAAEFPRVMDEAEETRADSLLLVASRLLDAKVSINRDDPESLMLAQIVVVDMVTNALIAGEHRGHQSYSWKNGALAGSGTVAADAESMRLMDWHLELFGQSSAVPRWSFPPASKWPER